MIHCKGTSPCTKLKSVTARELSCSRKCHSMMSSLHHSDNLFYASFDWGASTDWKVLNDKIFSLLWETYKQLHLAKLVFLYTSQSTLVFGKTTDFQEMTGELAPIDGSLAVTLGSCKSSGRLASGEHRTLRNSTAPGTIGLTCVCVGGGGRHTLLINSVRGEHHYWGWGQLTIFKICAGVEQVMSTADIIDRWDEMENFMFCCTNLITHWL